LNARLDPLEAERGTLGNILTCRLRKGAGQIQRPPATLLGSLRDTMLLWLMRWLLLVVGTVVLLGASPAMRYLLDAADVHVCARSAESDSGCPESERHCSNGVHVCICHAWPVFLPAAGIAEIASAGNFELLPVSDDTGLARAEHRLRVERPPQRV
jgi:hypothetical protein